MQKTVETPSAKTFDPIWEEFYAAGQQLNQYPFNYVPNIFFRHRPRNKPFSETHVLEVGFGAGNNLWMCAREGCQVYGVEAAPSGVAFAKQRFDQEGLNADLRLGDFTKLPFDDQSMDMVINRQALTHVTFNRSQLAVKEILRVLKPGGIFWSNMFSDQTDHNGDDLGGGLWGNITTGTLANIGQIAFHSLDDLKNMYSSGWMIEDIAHQRYETLIPEASIYCEWFVLARKKPL